MKFFIGIIIGAGLVIGGLFAYFWWGVVPVAVDEPPIPFEANLAHHAMHVVSERAAPKDEALHVNEGNLLAGVRHYTAHCAICHGLPGRPSRMYDAQWPHPPQLFDEKGMVADDPATVTYWKVASGIRMTGMPTFSRIMPEGDMWAVSLLLANADKLPQSVTDALNESQLPEP